MTMALEYTSLGNSVVVVVGYIGSLGSCVGLGEFLFGISSHSSRPSGDFRMAVLFPKSSCFVFSIGA
jgi:hypothetical protein